MKYLALFYTSHGASRFFKLCLNEGLSAKREPVPRELSPSCGTCVRFEAASAPQAEEHEDMEGCYIVTPSGAYLPTADIEKVAI